MKWNLRLAAAKRDIWKASDLHRALAEHGLVISAGKMSGLWSGQPVSMKLADLDVICVVLGCDVGELLVPEPERVTRPQQPDQLGAASAAPGASAPAPRTVTPGTTPRTVTPRRRDGRSLPPS